MREHLVEASGREAAAAMAAMREAATRAREMHARAELMRHMLVTARRAGGQPRAEAVRFIVDHWLAAWGLERGAWAHVAEMETLAGAFHDYAGEPTDTRDEAVRRAGAAVEAAFAGAGLPLADQMAWRSECAHGWWALIRPAPAGLRRPDSRGPERPFWDEGCPARCR